LRRRAHPRSDERIAGGCGRSGQGSRGPGSARRCRCAQPRALLVAPGAGRDRPTVVPPHLPPPHTTPTGAPGLGEDGTARRAVRRSSLEWHRGRHRRGLRALRRPLDRGARAVGDRPFAEGGQSWVRLLSPSSGTRFTALRGAVGSWSEAHDGSRRALPWSFTGDSARAPVPLAPSRGPSCASSASRRVSRRNASLDRAHP
jgi:hypothetical protein